MLLGRSAASADEIQPPVVHKFLKLRCQSCWGLQVFAFFIRQPRVRVAGNKLPRQLAQRADVVGHELRSCRAVHAKSQRLRMPQRCPHRFHGLPSQHRAHRLDRDRYDERHFAADLFRKRMNGQERRFDISRVLAGLDQQQIHSAFDESFRLRVISLTQFAERHAASNRNRLRRRPHGASHKPRLPGRTEFLRCLPSQLGRALVQEMRVRCQPVLRQHNRRPPKRIRLDDVRSGFKVLPVNIQNYIRPRSHQILIASFERSSAKVRRIQVALLQHRPHRAVQHEDPLPQQLPQSLR